MQLLNLNLSRILISLLFLTLCIFFTVQYLFLNNSSIVFQTYEQQLSIIRIEQLIENSKKWQWLGYVFIPIVVLIRVSFTTICLYTGFFIMNLKVRFKDIFKVALLADFVFVLAGITRLIILIFLKEVSTLNDLQFQPLSLMELFDKNGVDALFIYPFSLISVFELLYWLVLAWLLARLVELPFSRSLKTVASSYGSGLLLWVLFVMFLTVNLN